MTDLQKFKKDELIKFIKKEIEKHDKDISNLSSSFKKEYIAAVELWSDEFRKQRQLITTLSIALFTQLLLIILYLFIN